MGIYLNFHCNTAHSCALSAVRCREVLGWVVLRTVREQRRCAEEGKGYICETALSCLVLESPKERHGLCGSSHARCGIGVDCLTHLPRNRTGSIALSCQTGVVPPGGRDPKVDKLPHFGLPEDTSGMHELDIGNEEGFFSFEAERRGAAEVIGLENSPPMARNFEICRAALGSCARTHMGSVYDLNPRTLGTFDLVMFYGVLYHLRHPILVLQKITSVCTGTVLMQTAICDNTSDKPMAEFHPFGITSASRHSPA